MVFLSAVGPSLTNAVLGFVVLSGGDTGTSDSLTALTKNRCPYLASESMWPEQFSLDDPAIRAEDWPGVPAGGGHYVVFCTGLSDNWPVSPTMAISSPFYIYIFFWGLLLFSVNLQECFWEGASFSCFTFSLACCWFFRMCSRSFCHFSASF